MMASCASCGACGAGGPTRAGWFSGESHLGRSGPPRPQPHPHTISRAPPQGGAGRGGAGKGGEGRGGARLTVVVGRVVVGRATVWGIVMVVVVVRLGRRPAKVRDEHVVGGRARNVPASRGVGSGRAHPWRPAVWERPLWRGDLAEQPSPLVCDVILRTGHVHLQAAADAPATPAAAAPAAAAPAAASTVTGRTWACLRSRPSSPTQQQRDKAVGHGSDNSAERRRNMRGCLWSGADGVFGALRPELVG